MPTTHTHYVPRPPVDEQPLTPNTLRAAASTLIFGRRPSATRLSTAAQLPENTIQSILEFLDDDFFNFRPLDGDYDRNLDLTIFLHSGYDGSIGATDCETGKTNTERVASHARTGADLSTWRSKAGFALGPYAVSFQKSFPSLLFSP